jgi:hypothetical protein
MDRTTAYVLVVVTTILISGFVVLSVTHTDTTLYAVFLGGPAVAGLLGALLTKRTAAVQAVLADVKEATNGLLSARFADVTHKLDDASAERQDIAAAAPAVQAAHDATNQVPPQHRAGE